MSKRAFLSILLASLIAGGPMVVADPTTGGAASPLPAPVNPQNEFVSLFTHIWDSSVGNQPPSAAAIFFTALFVLRLTKLGKVPQTVVDSILARTRLENRPFILKEIARIEKAANDIRSEIDPKTGLPRLDMLRAAGTVYGQEMEKMEHLIAELEAMKAKHPTDKTFHKMIDGAVHQYRTTNDAAGFDVFDSHYKVRMAGWRSKLGTWKLGEQAAADGFVEHANAVTKRINPGRQDGSLLPLLSASNASGQRRPGTLYEGNAVLAHHEVIPTIERRCAFNLSEFSERVSTLRQQSHWVDNIMKKYMPKMALGFTAATGIAAASYWGATLWTQGKSPAVAEAERKFQNAVDTSTAVQAASSIDAQFKTREAEVASLTDVFIKILDDHHEEIIDRLQTATTKHNLPQTDMRRKRALLTKSADPERERQRRADLSFHILKAMPLAAKHHLGNAVTMDQVLKLFSLPNSDDKVRSTQSGYLRRVYSNVLDDVFPDIVGGDADDERDDEADEERSTSAGRGASWFVGPRIRNKLARATLPELGKLRLPVPDRVAPHPAIPELADLKAAPVPAGPAAGGGKAPGGQVGAVPRQSARSDVAVVPGG